MFALEPSALLLTRVQNKLKLDFECLRGDRTGKERAWKEAGSRRGWQGELGSANLPPSNLLLPSFPSS